jgi:hypothetical protein
MKRLLSCLMIMCFFAVSSFCNEWHVLKNEHVLDKIEKAVEEESATRACLGYNFDRTKVVYKFKRTVSFNQVFFNAFMPCTGQYAKYVAYATVRWTWPGENELMFSISDLSKPQSDNCSELKPIFVQTDVSMQPRVCFEYTDEYKALLKDKGNSNK